MKKNPKTKESAASPHSEKMATFVLVLIALVGVVGITNVWYNSASGAMNWNSNPGFSTATYNEASFYCRYDADCAFDEICALSKRPNNWMYACRASHTCERDMDCQGLGSAPSLMQCAKGWCKNKQNV